MQVKGDEVMSSFKNMKNLSKYDLMISYNLSWKISIFQLNVMHQFPQYSLNTTCLEIIVLCFVILINRKHLQYAKLISIGCN